MYVWYPQMAFQNGEDEICLSTLGRTYTIDLTVMKQINEDMGMARSIFRRVNANPTEGKSPTCSSRYVIHGSAIFYNRVFLFC